MDKQAYDEIRFQETKEKDKTERTKQIKKYVKALLWIVGIVLILSGSGWYVAKSGILAYKPRNLCVQHGRVGMHIHPHLKISIKGEEMQIPTNIGVNSSCMSPIHTHDGSGTLHLEFPSKQNVPLGDFFKIWEKEFDWTKAKMMVNEKENMELQNYMMQDGDQIELLFN